VEERKVTSISFRLAVISKFVRSESASCLRRLDENKGPVIDPSFSYAKAPSMQDTCKRRLQSDKAYVDEVNRVDTYLLYGYLVTLFCYINTS